jgi:hypothetical protein
MIEEEAINYLKQDGFDLFHIEERPTKIIICGFRNEPRGKWYKLEDGKLYERAGYDGLEHKWAEQEIIQGKLNSIREKENSK